MLQEPISGDGSLTHQPFAKTLHLRPKERVGTETSLKGVMRPLSGRHRERQAEGAVVDVGAK
jgi:hypothetical protein